MHIFIYNICCTIFVIYNICLFPGTFNILHISNRSTRSGSLLPWLNREKTDGAIISKGL